MSATPWSGAPAGPDSSAEWYCAAGLAPREPGLRVRVALAGADCDPRGDVSWGGRTGPPALEPALTDGDWVILAWAAEAPGRWQLVGRLIDHLRELARAPRAARPRRRFGARPFRSADEFVSWCPVPSPGPGPHWLRLRAGRLVDHHPGGPRGWVARSRVAR